MQLPLQVTFRSMVPSEAIEAVIRERAARLDKFASGVTSCRVVVEPAGKHHQHGNLYAVRIDLTVPGAEIAISRQPSKHREHRDIYVAIRDAFDALLRQLEDYVRRRRRDVKSLESPLHAKVSQLLPDGYGFLMTPDGREIYFHRNSVLNDAFERLQVGSEVTFAEEQGQKGPQASTVHLVGRHHHL